MEDLVFLQVRGTKSGTPLHRIWKPEKARKKVFGEERPTVPHNPQRHSSPDAKQTQGYVVNATATNVKLVASKTSAVTVENKEQLAELTIYKEGQVLIGAEVSESGTVFQYENRRQKNAVYNVYAGADIVTAYGTKVYSKGDLVKGRYVRLADWIGKCLPCQKRSVSLSGKSR